MTTNASMRRLWASLAAGLALTACHPPSRCPSEPRGPHEALGAAIEGARAAAEQADPSLVDVSVRFDASVTRYARAYRSREIIMNRGAMLRVARTYGHEAVWAIVAHEFGHLISDDYESQIPADEWAGCLTRSRGLSVEPFVRWLQSVATDVPRDVALARYVAARRGWSRCSEGSTIVHTETPNLPSTE